MLRGDSIQPPGEPGGSDIIKRIHMDHINSINPEVVSEIEKELDNYDLISLVFLLYDVPDTALQRLIILQRVTKDIEGSHVNLLQEWALNAQKAIPSWRHQFLEALAICQLHSIIRKLGCNVPAVKEHFSTSESSSSTYINPMKKALYQLCENMSSCTFENFKRTLSSFEMDVMQYDTCELVLLQLMCEKFITVNQLIPEKQDVCRCTVGKLLKIMDRDAELKQYTMTLRDIEKTMNNKVDEASTIASVLDTRSILNKKEDCANTTNNSDQLNDILNMFTDLDMEDIPVEFKSDRETLRSMVMERQEGGDRYPIKIKERVGICCIINQEVFHPSKDSIERGSTKPLERRDGSTRDKVRLEKTLRLLNFDIISKDNMNRKEMIALIQEVIHKSVSEDDSMFMLCILSHGIRGHVYAADSVAVKVDYIQNLLDDAPLLRGKPKVLILQACQVESEDMVPGLAADGPQYTLRKTDFLVYWATSPELEAFRSPELGSFFIQILCRIMEKFANREHLFDLFTKVTNEVTLLCSLRPECEQVPIFKSTLRKKLFLQLPSN